MSSSFRSSPASRVFAVLLALLSAISAAAIGFAISRGGATGEAGLFGAYGSLLYGSVYWASLYVPLWLAAAAWLALLPKFKPGAIFGLVTSIFPFFVLALFARFNADPASAYQAMPSLEAFGTPTLGFFAVLVALFLSLAIIRLSMLLFPSRGKEDHDEAGSLFEPRRLLGSASPEALRADEDAGGQAEGSGELEANLKATRDFVVPTLPPPPRLTSLEGKADKASFEGGREAPSSDSPMGGELALARSSAGEEPIPLYFAPIRKSEDERASLSAGSDANEGKPKKDGKVEVVEIGLANSTHAVEFTSVPPGKGGTVAAPGILAASGFAVEAEGGEEGGTALVGTLVGRAGDGSEADGEAITEREAAAVREAAREAAALRVLARKQRKAYTVPVEELLNAYPDGQYWVVDEKTKRSAEVLQETLAEFNIKAEVTGIRKGPVITMFEILPAPGVRLSKIANLADNIALRLAASSVRIVAPIPGKHAVGIEVPNERRSIVSLREIVENEAFRTAKMEIPVVLGKDIAGEAQFIDLVQTPHLLIAGATGSGKSVCVNSIILSILFRRNPEDVRLILIDPKIVELKLYNDVPHLLTPVITEPKRAFQALQYCICEMERRYTMLDRLGVRDIKSYNKKIKEKGFVQERLPYYVVIIDEFADLMATTGKELESTLARLAAMSRAVGIHLVLATQRPSIDVITGLIKANIPSRIAFMVASKFDSRIIIDMVGAEKLLGRGDMLFASAWDPFPIRMQGAFVSEEEVEKSVAFVKTLGEPEYIDDEIFIDEEEEDEGPSLFDDSDGDPLFEQALEIVLQQGRASASYIQRKLKIGYNRAARIVELMEEKGIVGPAQGSKPRDLVRNPEIASLRSQESQARRDGQAGARNETAGEPGKAAVGAERPKLMPDLETLPGQRVTGKDED